jgi:hypothetical protein
VQENEDANARSQVPRMFPNISTTILWCCLNGNLNLANSAKQINSMMNKKQPCILFFALLSQICTEKFGDLTSHTVSSPSDARKQRNTVLSKKCLLWRNIKEVGIQLFLLKEVTDSPSVCWWTNKPNGVEVCG